MSRRRRKKQKSSDDVFDGLDVAGGLLDMGPLGWAIGLLGGAIAVVVGVFKFMDRRN